MRVSRTVLRGALGETPEVYSLHKKGTKVHITEKTHENLPAESSGSIFVFCVHILSLSLLCTFVPFLWLLTF